METIDNAVADDVNVLTDEIIKSSVYYQKLSDELDELKPQYKEDLLQGEDETSYKLTSAVLH